MTPYLAACIAAEQQRARTLHPGKTPADDIDDGTRLAILVEEVGEVSRALLDDPAGVEEELVQVAAVACSWLAWISGERL